MLSMAAQDNSDFNLVMSGSDILVFSNKTFINLTWHQNNDMDIIDDYILSANVSVKFCFPIITNNHNAFCTLFR